MRLVRPNYLFFGAAYMAAVAAVIMGAPHGMGLALSTVEQPSFLVPEHENQVFAKNPGATSEVAVLLKPYVPPTITQARWRPSIGRSYVVQSKRKAHSKTAYEEKAKAKSQKRSSIKPK
jgi:hypothetical protein